MQVAGEQVEGEPLCAEVETVIVHLRQLSNF